MLSPTNVVGAHRLAAVAINATARFFTDALPDDREGFAIDIWATVSSLRWSQ